MTFFIDNNLITDNFQKKISLLELYDFNILRHKMLRLDHYKWNKVVVHYTVRAPKSAS